MEQFLKNFTNPLASIYNQQCKVSLINIDKLPMVFSVNLTSQG